MFPSRLCPPRMLPALAIAAALGATVLALLPAAAPSDAWQGPAHIAAFAVIGALFAATIPGRPWAGMIAATLLGAAIEAAQSLVPGRTASLDDMAANLLGIAAGTLLAMAAARIARTHRPASR